MDVDDPGFVFSGEEAYSMDMILRVFQPFDEKMFDNPCDNGGVCPLLVSEVGHDTSHCDGLEDLQDLLDSFRVRYREGLQNLMVKFHRKHGLSLRIFLGGVLLTQEL